MKRVSSLFCEYERCKRRLVDICFVCKENNKYF